jgi:hypothetical protein
LRKVALRHLSWWQVMTEARVEHKHRGISDPDQAWILGELIAYLDHERAGAGGFDDMGDRWVSVRDGAREATLKASDLAVRDIAGRWEQLIGYLSLGLTQDLGRQVEPMWRGRWIRHIVATFTSGRWWTTASYSRRSAYQMRPGRSTSRRIFAVDGCGPRS